MIEVIRWGLKEEGIVVSISRLCWWFEVPRRTFYYLSVKAPPKVQPRFAEPIKAMIEDNPSFGYRTVATCWGSTRTRCSGRSSCAAGRSGSARSGFGRGSKLGAQGHLSPTNAGRRISAVFGRDETAGPHWHW